MKKILILILFIIVAIPLYLGFYLSKRQTLIYPSTYLFTDTPFPHSNEAQGAHFLIIGDKMAHSLEEEKSLLLEKISSRLSKPITLFNWGTRDEGIHRTREKLTRIPKLPPVILYYGGSDEFVEPRINLSDYERIKENLATYSDSEMLTMITIYPPLSKILYKPQTIFKLSPDKINYKAAQTTDVTRQQEFELLYLFFEHELDQMAVLTKSKQSTLILATLPLNHHVAPRRVCNNSTNDNLEIILDEIEEKISQGNFKSTHQELIEITTQIEGNGRAHFLLSKTARALGDMKRAYSEFLKSTAYDCDQWRGNGVYNAIIRKVAAKHNLPLIDFEKKIFFETSDESLFLSDLFPQKLFQNVFINDVVKEVRLRLNI